MAQRVFHGLDPITPELKEIIYSCTTCLMCQELCGVWADGLGFDKIAEGHAQTLFLAGCSADQASGRAGVVALAKLMQKAGEDFAILGDEEKCCGLHAYDLGFRREYERLQQENLDTITKAGVRRVVIACGS